MIGYHYDAELVGVGIVHIDQLAHADGEVLAGAPIGDLEPRPVDVDRDKEVGRAVALVLAVVSVSLSGLRRDRHAPLADQLDRTFIEADHGSLGIMRLGIQIEQILHAGDVLAVDIGDAPHLLLPGL